MIESEKTQYVRIALSLAGVVVSDPAAEVIWRVYEAIQKKKGKFDLGDAMAIETLVKDKEIRKSNKKKVSLEKE